MVKSCNRCECGATPQNNMQTWWIVLASGNLVLVLAAYLQWLWGSRCIAKVAEQPWELAGPWPSVSIIVAARNEQRHIAAALEALLQLDYDPYEVVVVNDRSTDRTGEILEALAAQHERLTVVQVDSLPAGWLGKNHALFCGAQRTQSDYLLFTDADVFLERTILRRAMGYVRRFQVDHLTISPDCEMPSILLQAFVVLFVNMFFSYTRPWKVSDPKSSAFVGIGAFNLVRREVYEAVGTHRTIAMRPDDDLKLGKIIKGSGFRQHILGGYGMLRVPWYGSLRELVHGLEKNAFSGVDYRVWLVVLATAALLTLDVWPFLAVWLLEGLPRYLYLGTIAVIWLHALQTARQMRQSLWSAFLFPVAVLLMIFIQWRAMILTYWNNGIRWRDTHYPLSELKANKV